MATDYTLVWRGSVPPPAPFDGSIVGPPGGGTLTATRVFTSAEMKTLFSTPYTLIAAPGAGKFIQPLDYTVLLVLPGGSSKFVGDVEPRLFYGGIGIGNLAVEVSNYTKFNQIITNTVSSFGQQTVLGINASVPANDPPPQPENSSLIVRGISGNLDELTGQTDGLATVKFVIRYILRDTL